MLYLTIIKWGDCMYKKSILLVSIVATIIIFFEQTKKPAITQESRKLCLKHNLNSFETTKGGAFNG